MTQSRLLRIANVVMFFVFVSWAVFQYNDPDFLVWALVYSLAALCCLLFFMGRLSPSFGAALVVGSLIWAGFLGYFVLTADEPYSFTDEGTGAMAREAIGLLIVAAWVGFLSRKTTLLKRTSRSS